MNPRGFPEESLRNPWDSLGDSLMMWIKWVILSTSIFFAIRNNYIHIISKEKKRNCRMNDKMKFVFGCHILKMALTALHSKVITQHTKQCHEGQKRHLRRHHFSKGLTKLAILPDYKCPGLICLALPPGQKFGPILMIKFLNFVCQKSSEFL